MQKSQPTPDGGYLQENRMESEGNVETCSISRGETDGKDGVYHHLINQIVSRTNLNRAYEKVKANNGAAGVDGMNVQALYAYVVLNKHTIISEIKNGTYEPQPVKRVEIDKEDGSKENWEFLSERPSDPTGYTPSLGKNHRLHIFGRQLRVQTEPQRSLMTRCVERKNTMKRVTGQW